jgi:hypothetical protein
LTLHPYASTTPPLYLGLISKAAPSVLDVTTAAMVPVTSSTLIILLSSAASLSTLTVLS